MLIPQVTVCFAISMSCVLVSGQFFGSYDNAYRFGYDSNEFGGIGSFGQVSGGAANIRDPRQNRGKNLYFTSNVFGLVGFFHPVWWSRHSKSKQSSVVSVSYPHKPMRTKRFKLPTIQRPRGRWHYWAKMSNNFYLRRDWNYGYFVKHSKS